MTAKLLNGGPNVRIGITGVSGDVGIGAIAGLRASRRACWILGLDCSNDCAGFHMCDAYEQVKPVNHRGYLEDLQRILLEYKIQLLFCGVDSEVALLSRSRTALQERTGCAVIVGEYSLVRPFTDKLQTARLLERHGLHPPKTWNASAVSDTDELSEYLPLVAKPRRGNAGKGLRLLRTTNELIAFLRSSQRNFCIQQFIDGPEYTCGLLFDKERVLKDWICARRLLADGRTIQARIVQDPALDYFIQTFAAKFPFEGPLNLQLRMDADGHPRTFEVNPRLSGSTSMRVAVGFNDPERVLEHWLFDTSIVRAQCNCATVYRYLTQLVVPE